jgi:hypothetical protein
VPGSGSILSLITEYWGACNECVKVDRQLRSVEKRPRQSNKKKENQSHATISVVAYGSRNAINDGDGQC